MYIVFNKYSKTRTTVFQICYYMNETCVTTLACDLSGESVPVTKTPLPNDGATLYDSKEHARHTLYCGTQVIQTRYYGNHSVYAVVISTGFNTSKGSLVRSILYPPPVDFKFEQDSYKFVQLLALIASVGFCYTVITKVRHLLSVAFWMCFSFWKSRKYSTYRFPFHDFRFSLVLLFKSQ